MKPSTIARPPKKAAPGSGAGEYYDDEFLYKSREEAVKLVELAKLGNDSQCVIFPIQTYVDKQQWTLKQLLRKDPRLETMAREMDITHALPIQRYCWPQMSLNAFALFSIAPEGSGKTYTHLLYMMAKCITEIPLAKTEQLLMASDQFSSVSINDQDGPKAATSGATKRNESANPPEDETELEIDQTQFDFNQLGREKVTDNGSEAPKSGDGWSCDDNATQQLNLNDFVLHPSYIIVTSSQMQTEVIELELDRMKSAAYGPLATLARRQSLPPVVRSIKCHQDEDKLAVKCNEAKILVATPNALLKCLKLGYINFSRSKQLILDELDLALQLHNSTIREIMKYFLAQQQDDQQQGDEDEREAAPEEGCQVCAFSRKWTDLVRQLASSVFPQRVIIFGSILEAALFANIRFDSEKYQSEKNKLTRLRDLISVIKSEHGHKRLAIVCNSEPESEALAESLKDLNVKHLLEESTIEALSSSRFNQSNGGRPGDSELTIYLMSDLALEFAVELITDMDHLVHYSQPEDDLLFDQRFRLMYKHIKDCRKGLVTTLFFGDKLPVRRAKRLLDVFSRSGSTLLSTKLELRDSLADTSSNICWRWATQGVCRLEKLCQEDKFGSYCACKHSLTESNHNECKNIASNGAQTSTVVPIGSQCKITITHIVSPNEFYFWFEAFRNIDSPERQWTSFKRSGYDFMLRFQQRLDAFKGTPSCSLAPVDLKTGKIYGVFVPEESRVDRIMLMEEPRLTLPQPLHGGNPLLLNGATATGEGVSTRDRLIAGAGFKKNGMLSNLARITYYQEYSKQYEAFKVDYGTVASVYVRNIFELPPNLSAIEPQCHRGFLIGVKPCDNEPIWLHKAKKLFYEQVSVGRIDCITAWLRMSNSQCHWFEHMTVLRCLENLENVRYTSGHPHRELCKAGLADECHAEPSWLVPSKRPITLSKWANDDIIKDAKYAYMPADMTCGVYLLRVRENLNVVVRQACFNKQLINLENDIADAVANRQLHPLNYFVVGVLCIARIDESADDSQPQYSLNRCKIVEIAELPSNKTKTNPRGFAIKVECLDHGDFSVVLPEDLFAPKARHISTLPFQAIPARLAELNQDLVGEAASVAKVMDLIYTYSRGPCNQLLELQCTRNELSELYLYCPVTSDRGSNPDNNAAATADDEPLPTRVQTYAPLIGILEAQHGVRLCTSDEPRLREDLQITKTREDDDARDGADAHVRFMFKMLTRTMVKRMVCEELASVGVSENLSDSGNFFDKLLLHWQTTNPGPPMTNNGC